MTNLLTIITYLSIGITIIGITGFAIYKLSQKLINYRVKTEYQYNEYYKAKHELEDVETDLRRQLKEDGFDTEPKPFTQDDMRKWEVRTRQK